MIKAATRPSRYGYALRRLADGKTDAISWKVAYALADAGFVTLTNPGVKSSAVPVTITEAGRAAAAKSKKGISVAAGLGIQARPDTRRSR